MPNQQALLPHNW